MRSKSLIASVRPRRAAKARRDGCAIATGLDGRLVDPLLVDQHIRRAARLLADHHADGLFLFRDTNILGFCGVPLAPYDRLICGLLNADGRVALVAPTFEAEMAQGLPRGARLFGWQEHEDPYAAVGAAAGQLGIASGKILLDSGTWIEVQAGLASTLPRAKLAADQGLIEEVRITKSPEEVAAVRAACADTGKIYPLVKRFLRAGITECALAKKAIHRLIDDGLTPRGELIQGGPNAAVPHRKAGARPLRTGDAVVVDFVCGQASYVGDMTRTFAVGQPSAELRRVYAVVREAQRAAIDAVRPAIPCEDVDRVARDVIERAGLGRYFTHRLGHGVGLDIHEPPFLVRGNKRLLEPGMCVTIEPGVYLPGQFGVRIEDVVVVTKDGCAVLTNDVPTDVSAALA